MLINDEKILRGKNVDVDPDEASNLINTLENELKYSSLAGKPGVGLAAPQIGINKKAAIIRISGNNTKDISINLINAEIKKCYHPFIFKNEGCLSIDDFTTNTKRYKEIVVSNNYLIQQTFVATGFLAVAIQHELDHLNGVLIKDKSINLNSIKSNDLCPCGSKMKFKKCCK